MYCNPNNLQLIEKINILAFEKYLIAKGWNKHIASNDVNDVFYIMAPDYVQVEIPIKKDLSDYQIAIYRAIVTVAEYESVPVDDLLNNLLNPSSDIIKIRIQNKNVEKGEINMDSAINIYNNTKKMLASAAMDYLHPQKMHGSYCSPLINKFISSCKFGQTEIGSYIIPVVCPLGDIDDNDNYEQLSLFSEEERLASSFTRNVTSNVIFNISKIKNFIDSGNLDKLNYDIASNPISGNFYEALRNIISEDNTDIDINMAWAPIVRDKPEISNIRFNHDYVEPIDTVISRYKKSNPNIAKIAGRVKALSAKEVISERTGGTVTIAYLGDDGHKKTIQVILNNNDYSMAIQAHNSGCWVLVTDVVVNEKTGKVIEYGDFSIL